MLEELGLAYDHLLVMPQSRKLKGLNPLGKVPVLIERSESDSNGSNDKPLFVMYESAAINTYLGDLVNRMQESNNYNGHNGERLVPLAGTHERGLFDQTVSCIITELDSQSLWIHRKHDAMGNIFGHIPKAVEHAKSHFNTVNAVLAQQIRDNAISNYLVGSNFTAADILYIHCLDWSRSIGWDDQWKKDEQLCEYVKNCTDRPAYRQVAEMRAEEMKAIKAKSGL